MTRPTAAPAGADPRAPLYAEMERQFTDALASLDTAAARAAEVRDSLARTGRLVLLGMGGSHAVGRAVAPLYRAAGIDAVAVPLSEQLDAPLPLDGRSVIVTSQSGESAEVLRWFDETGRRNDTFGLTMEGTSTLAARAPCLIGAGGSEIPFAATRSLTVTLALHAAILAALGAGPEDLRARLAAPPAVGIDAALAAVAEVRTLVCSGRALVGVAEAIALGLTELSRRPCFALEGGQLRHGPLEMLSPEVGVVMFRGADPTAELVARLAEATVAAAAPTVVFDCSGQSPVAGATTVALPDAGGLAAIFSLLGPAQRFMVEFAAARVPDVGTPVRSSKVTRVE